MLCERMAVQVPPDVDLLEPRLAVVCRQLPGLLKPPELIQPDEQHVRKLLHLTSTKLCLDSLQCSLHSECPTRNVLQVFIDG